MSELRYVTSERRQKKALGVTAKSRAKRRRAVGKVAKSVRAECVERSGDGCERCGVWIGGGWNTGHAHHRVPRSRGGKWTVENIEMLCSRCHSEAHRTNNL